MDVSLLILVALVLGVLWRYKGFRLRDRRLNSVLSQPRGRRAGSLGLMNGTSWQRRRMGVVFVNCR
jgi:hypothetical protein